MTSIDYKALYEAKCVETDELWAIRKTMVKTYEGIIQERNDEIETLKEQLKETLKQNIDREYQHICFSDKLDDEIIKLTEEKKTLRKENETLKMKLVSLEEFKEKAFEENTASAVVETMMVRIDKLEQEENNYKNRIQQLKEGEKRSLKHYHDCEALILSIVTGDNGNNFQNIDERIMKGLKQDELDILLETLENNGIYYCSGDDDFSQGEAEIFDDEMCNQYRQDRDDDDDEDIDVEEYCNWYCDNYGVMRHWLDEGFLWTK